MYIKRIKATIIEIHKMIKKIKIQLKNKMNRINLKRKINKDKKIMRNN